MAWCWIWFVCWIGFELPESGGNRPFAFVPPTQAALPQVSDPAWPRNAIDYFVLERLDRAGLRPSPEAEKHSLIRRVTLDLTGLPPTIEEVRAFQADSFPDAYERVVDRLLSSPRYGERMAVPWLNAARYADTSGYQNDGPRHMWRWRDWVTDAFNHNMPFDQFTVEQIAGDMLPGSTLEQRIATGFNRNHRGNSEGGIIPEEYAVEYVVDRVDTTATVFLGLTMGCARCHDHKYDPITQRDFYRVYAYFNNVPEHGRAIKEGNSPPYVQAPTAEDLERLCQLDSQLRNAIQQAAALVSDRAAAQVLWEKSFATRDSIHWAPDRGLVAHFTLDADTPTDLWKGESAFQPGLLGKAADLDGSRFVSAGDIANFGYFDKFSFAAWIQPRDEGGTILSRMTDAKQADGYAVTLEQGHVHVHLVKRWLDDSIRVQTARALEPGRWHHVAVTYDGSRRAGGIQIFINGRLEPLKINLDYINQSFATKEPLRIGGGGGPDGRFHGLMDDVRVYDRVLSHDEVSILATPESISAILDRPTKLRSAAQTTKLAAYFLEHHAAEPIRQAHQRLTELREARQELLEQIPTVMVMEEMSQPRDTFVLLRGVYDKPGEKVTPGVPQSLPALPPGQPNNRLGFARWLVDAANPLTARVAVNRYWQIYFGNGLVKTAEDFGTQAEPPSHPELLDWLAVEFIRLGWDVKAMQRLIVTSATYRQSSKVTPELLQRDAENRLLARGPRLRLSAEMIRDQALASSGLLVEKLGGPSVRPYQPPGLWKELTGADDYVQDHGEKLYRRSMYTFWKRTAAPPSMVAFDASSREMCTVRETRTNTPLQALTLMNERAFVEAARALAQRMMIEGGPSVDERIAFAFQLVTARQPKPEELDVLRRGWSEHSATFRDDRDAALQLVTVGESPRDHSLDASEMAAYAAVAGLILNLDEAITKD